VDWTSLKNSVLIGRVLAVKHSVTRVRNRRGVKRKFLGRNYVACELTRDKVKGRVGRTSNWERKLKDFFYFLMAKNRTVKSVALHRIKSVKNESHLFKKIQLPVKYSYLWNSTYSRLPNFTTAKIQLSVEFSIQPASKLHHNKMSRSPLSLPPTEIFNIVLSVRIAITGTITAVSAVTCFALNFPTSSDILYKLSASH